MAHKIKKFEKMIRGDPICEQVSYEKEVVDKIILNELEHYKQQIFVNSLNHLKNNALKEKCLDIITHYRLFKNDESRFVVGELSTTEKFELKNCIGECIQKECTSIIDQKEFIPKDLLQLINSNLDIHNTLKSKLNTMLSLLAKYTNNKKEIINSMHELLDSSNGNILKIRQLADQADILKANSYKVQSDIISKISSSENVLESLEKYYKTRENEYATNLIELEELEKLQNKYKEVDGPQFRALIKRYVRVQEMIKIKTEMLNNY